MVTLEVFLWINPVHTYREGMAFFSEIRCIEIRFDKLQKCVFRQILDFEIIQNMAFIR